MGKHVEEHVHLEVDSDEFVHDKPELIRMLKEAFGEQDIVFEITNEIEDAE
jgi:hypothetical protein